MKKYIILYTATAEALKQMEEADELQGNLDPWIEWANQCGDKLIDMGTPLKPGIILHSEGSSESSGNGICGYSVLAAEDMDEAMELLEGHPHFGDSTGCSIEVHETIPLPTVQD